MRRPATLVSALLGRQGSGRDSSRFVPLWHFQQDPLLPSSSVPPSLRAPWLRLQFLLVLVFLLLYKAQLFFCSPFAAADSPPIVVLFLVLLVSRFHTAPYTRQLSFRKRKSTLVPSLAQLAPPTRHDMT
ncbi:hypothetical protein BS78_01G156400 [Paspalum vaginatum]|nr:hypothetical protein BS78_01G156400 [Paspalum vaginatum]